jgi:hypothetical protein
MLASVRRLVPTLGPGAVGRSIDGAAKGLALGLVLGGAGALWVTATADVSDGVSWWEGLHPAAATVMRWAANAPWIGAAGGSVVGLLVWFIRAVRSGRSNPSGQASASTEVR